MFDYLRIDPDLLPVSAEEKCLLSCACGGEFQTKSLHKDLTMVEITSKGRLLWAWFDHRVYLSEQDLPEEYMVKEGTQAMEFDGFLVPLSKITWIEEKEFTGEVRFYDSIEKEWYESSALFENGGLIKISKLSPC